MPYGSDGYYISRIGPINVPSGAHVVIRDQAVVSTVPVAAPIEKIRLEARSNPIAVGDSHAISAEVRQDESQYPATLDIPALAASFGPSIAHRPPEAIPPGSKPFMLDGQPLPLHLPRFDILGCEPPSEQPAVGSGRREPHLLLLHRGHCSFALKSHHAALAGAKGVIVISHPTPTDDEEGHNLGGFVVPGAEATEEADETMDALVPLVLVANSTGQALESMVRRAEELAVDEIVPEAVARPPAEQVVLEGGMRPPKQRVMVRLVAEPEPLEPEEEEKHVDGLILGGYLVRNIKLHRIRNASPPSP